MSTAHKVGIQHLREPNAHLVAHTPQLRGRGSDLWAEEMDIVHRSRPRMGHAGKVTKLKDKTKRWRTRIRSVLALGEAAVEEVLCHDGNDVRAAVH